MSEVSMATRLVTKKQYDCVIEVLWEFQGFIIGLMSKGHHDPATFRDKAREFLSDESKPYREVRVYRESLGDWVRDDEPVLHKWWRYVPACGCDEGMPCDAVPGSRGAYPVTVLYRY